jgi:dTDP-4-amino-4,6-dideoxygalactose transaminase
VTPRQSLTKSTNPAPPSAPKLLFPFLDLKAEYATMKEEIQAAIEQVMESQQFIMGPQVRELEAEVASLIGSDFAIACASGSDALLLPLMALGIDSGDEVITAPFTFISSAWGINYVGATPVFADIEEGTFNLDPDRLAAAVTPRTKGIIVVHLFGQPARMDEIMAVAKRHNLFVIEDCAKAVGAKYRGAPVGLAGDVGTFSFYPTKNLGGCGEGGAFVSKHAAVMDQARLLRVHGPPHPRAWLGPPLLP